jgi:excisionase family DNA binding protein
MKKANSLSLAEIEPRLRSVADTAAMLSISESTVWMWIREGRIANVQLGRRRLIRSDAIAEILEQGLAA